jgi:hypothetical protein
MRPGTRALVELTSWLTQHLWEFFAIVPAAHEFEDRLEALNGRDLDATFAWADIYRLQFFPDVLSTEPRGILPPGYEAPLLKEPQVKYTFAMWSHLDARNAADDEDSSPPALRLGDGPVPAFRFMRRHIIPDLFGRPSSEGVARRRLARLAEILDQRIPGHQFQHFATVPSGSDLVSVFVDLESLARVAGVIDARA